MSDLEAIATVYEQVDHYLEGLRDTEKAADGNGYQGTEKQGRACGAL